MTPRYDKLHLLINVCLVLTFFYRFQVLIRVGSAGVNPVDTYIRMGLFAQLPTLPYIPGRDGSGTVEKVGAQVDSLKVICTNFIFSLLHSFQYYLLFQQVGDRVFFSGASGSYAQYVACESQSVFPLADRLTFAQGAALGVPYFTAYRALFIK